MFHSVPAPKFFEKIALKNGSDALVTIRQHLFFNAILTYIYGIK